MEAEAIAKLFQGEAKPVCQSMDYIEVNEDFGLPTDEYPELAGGSAKTGRVSGR